MLRPGTEILGGECRGGSPRDKFWLFSTRSMGQKFSCISGLRRTSVGQSQDRKLWDSNGVFMKLKQCLQDATKIIYKIEIWRHNFNFLDIFWSNVPKARLITQSDIQTVHWFSNNLCWPVLIREVQIFSPDPLQVHDHETKICKWRRS